MVDTNALEWRSGSVSGAVEMPLYTQRGYSDETRLQRWDAGANVGAAVYEHGAEIFVLDGEFADEEGAQ